MRIGSGRPSGSPVRRPPHRAELLVELVVRLDREPAVGAVVGDGTFFFALEDPKSGTPYFDFTLGLKPPVFVE